MLVEDDEPGGTTVLKIAGMVKAGETVRDLESSLERAAAERTGAVILDLTDLEYMDSTAVGVLVGFLHRLKGEERDLLLVKPRERIASLLHVANLDSLFEIHETVEQARAALEDKEGDTGAR
ncbi:MAG: STAS domain-containing protein [Acidobacteriota bacterium]